jgi:hypothetical protein
MLNETGGIMAPNAILRHRSLLTYAREMKFPRIIRPEGGPAGRPVTAPARAGEWAVTGGFRFAHRDPATLRPAEMETFKHGWLGLESFGDGRVVEVAEVAPAEYETLTRRLAAYYVAEYGIANIHEAMEAAEQEMAFAASLCGHPLRTRLELDRELNEQGLIELARPAR